MRLTRSWIPAPAVALATLILLAACSAGGGSPAPTSADDAVRLVLAEDERFTGIGPRNPDLIGQSAYHDVSDSADGWRVVVWIGWGDCPAGCIDHHSWTYDVSRSGSVELVSEEGSPLPGETGVTGTVTAGPTCPVVTDPPDPNCADRPVAGAVLVLVDAGGAEVARVTSAADGTFAVALAPGAYRLVPQPVEGLMGTAPEIEFRVEAGEATEELLVVYDTGIR